VDNRVTTESLFNFIQTIQADSERTQVQTPKIQGNLRETLFEYRSTPSLHRGYATWADEKTAYAKVIVICRALAETSFQNVLALHRHLTKKYARSFETLHKQVDGTFTYVPVGHKVVARYLGFMDRIGLLHSSALAYHPRSIAGIQLGRAGQRIAFGRSRQLSPSQGDDM